MIGMIAISSGKSILGKKRLFIFYNLKTPQRGAKTTRTLRAQTIPMLRIQFGDNRHHAKVCKRGVCDAACYG
ncbi:hypothetical protein D0784_26315 [Vibrio campbellii]|nr:hypothetical protein CAY59_23050 [Vibrio campbellii]PNM51009.1 hypothetical protein AL469_002585 [Vibrio harveyi]AUW07112.1 hypothetical protein C1N51_26270 [Vibrio campbellii]AYO12796.1 hypothetical protein D0784_26315 [Vibrio campbellii]OPH54286.1 hypothetical protein B4U81_08270 [Vibrio campbellii]